MSVRPGISSQDLGDESDGDDEEIIKNIGLGCKPEKISVDREERFVRKLIDPKLPTEREIYEHECMGHVVYRNWCPVCVMSSGKDWPHKDNSDKERKLPEYHFDYCFPGDEFGYRLTILAGREQNWESLDGDSGPDKRCHWEIRNGSLP